MSAANRAKKGGRSGTAKSSMKIFCKFLTRLIETEDTISLVRSGGRDGSKRGKRESPETVR
jgi:hypothetical protein